MVVSLESARISLERDESIGLTFQMLPDTIRSTVSANYAEIPIIGRSEPVRVYKNSNGRQLGFTLNFYASIQENDTDSSPQIVKTNVLFLEALTYPEKLPSGLSSNPPVVIVQIGNLYESRGIIRSANTVWYGPWTLVARNNPEQDAIDQENAENELLLLEDPTADVQSSSEFEDLPPVENAPDLPMGAKVELIFEEVNIEPKFSKGVRGEIGNAPLEGGFEGPSFDGGGIESPGL